MSSFRTIVIASPCRLSYKSGYLVVRKEDDTVKIHLSEISTITLQTQQVFISAYLMSELAHHKISLVISDGQQNPVGQYLPLYGAHNVSKRINEQIGWTEPAKKRVWQRVIKDKICNQARVVEKVGNTDVSEILFQLAEEVKSGDTTNREAFAARLYFQSLFGETFTRNQETDVNDALNYGYAVLLSLTNREIVSRGYLTELGICHRNEYNQFNFSCDLMEPFRPVVDCMVEEHNADGFDSQFRLELGNLANRSLHYRGGIYRLSSVLSLYIQDCFLALNKQISAERIERFTLL